MRESRGEKRDVCFEVRCLISNLESRFVFFPLDIENETAPGFRLCRRLNPVGAWGVIGPVAASLRIGRESLPGSVDRAFRSVTACRCFQKPNKAGASSTRLCAGKCIESAGCKFLPGCAGTP